MNVGLIGKRVGMGLLAVCNYLQLEASITHTWHIVIACVSIFLAFVLGEVTSPKTESTQVKI